MRLRKFIGVLSLLASVAGLPACGPEGSNSGRASGGVEITVSAAVSLKDAFAEIGKMYSERTGNRVSFNFGASGALQDQIEGGAPVDVFASAGTRQMDVLGSKGLIDAASRKDIAGNVLILIVPKDSRLGINTFSALTGSDVTKIAVGNPATVPAGQYAAELLNTRGMAKGVQPKLILAENVRQVLDYVARGEVDAGIVYQTDAAIRGGEVRTVAKSDPGDHDPIRYPIAIVSASTQKKAAQAFVDLVLSADGQAILAKYGFENLKAN